MARLFVDPVGKRLVTVSAKVREDQRPTLAERGGSAYMRLVLSTPVPVEHRIVKAKKK